MALNLLKIGLVFVPFYEMCLRVLPFVKIADGVDTRVPKEAISVIVALVIFGFYIFREKIKPVNNKWLLLFLGSMFVTINLIPEVALAINGVEVLNFWVWKPTFNIISYFLLFCAVSSMEIDDKVFTVMIWCGFVMAIYVILQFFGLDQFYLVKESKLIGPVTNPAVAGNLGQPTIVAPFISMLVPIAFYLKRWWLASVMMLGVILTYSMVGIVGMVLSLGVLLTTIRRSSLYLTIPTLLIGLLLIFWLAEQGNSKVLAMLNANGRFGAWEAILVQFKQKNLCLFGLGPNSFQYLFHSINKTYQNFHQAHNDYLEILFNYGVVGLGFFLMSIVHLIRTGIKNISDQKIKYLLSSFACISLCAFGTFVWQIHAIALYSVVICGIIYNVNNHKQEALK